MQGQELCINCELNKQAGDVWNGLAYTLTLLQKRSNTFENTHTQILYRHMQNYTTIPMVVIPKSGKV